MISIFIDGKQADYFGSLTIKKDNPLFAELEKEPAEHTYTLTLPTTSINAKIFSVVQHTLAKPAILPARIEVDGVVVLDGSCNVQSWNDSGYSVYFSGVVPYEDVANNPIKKLLSDKRPLTEVFDSYSEWVGLDVNSFGVIEYKTNGELAIVKSHVQVRFPNSSIIQSSLSGRIGFNIDYLVGEIAKYYGVTIDRPPFADDFIVANATPQANYSSKYLSSLLPQYSALELLKNLAIIDNKKINVDYKLQKITFMDMSQVLNFPPSENRLNVSAYSLDWQKNETFEKRIITKQVSPIRYEYVYGNNNEKRVTYFDLVEDKEVEINPNGNKDYELMLAIPAQYRTTIVFAEDDRYDNDGKPADLEDNQWNYFVIASWNDLLDLDGEIGWWIPPASFTFNNYYKLRELIAERHTTIKMNVRLSSVEFATINYWKPIYIDNVGKVWLKTINFKPDGESDIEGYLY